MSIVAFECRMCGHCCHGKGGIVMTEKDQTRLAGHLDISVSELVENILKNAAGSCI